MSNVTLAQVDSAFSKVLENFREELAKLRSGRANPDLVKNIQVNAYGQSMPIEQLANINVADASLLVVQPWDKSVLEAVKKAIETEDIGINPVVDGELIRLPMPPMTEERRQEYVKLLKEKTEDARIRVRQIRKEVLDDLDQKKESGEISEDELARGEKELQSKVDRENEKIEEISEEKEKDLMTV